MTDITTIKSTNGTFDIAGTTIVMRGKPIDGEAIATQVGDMVFIAYLKHDAYAQNPLEDCDGEGRIYSVRNASSTKVDMQKALGLTPEWDRNYDAPAVQAIIAEKAMTLLMADTEFIADAKAFFEVDSVEEVREKVWDSYYNPETYHHSWVSRDFPQAPIDEEALCDEAWVQARATGKIGNPFSVMLDIYEHGLVRYSVGGERTQCNFDTSRGGAVWVPDSCFERELWDIALATADAAIKEKPSVYQWLPNENGQDYGDGIKKSYTLVTPAEYTAVHQGQVLGTYLSYKEAREKVMTHLGSSFDIVAAFEATRPAACERARSACEQYSAFVNGECYLTKTEEWHVTTVDGEVYSRFVESKNGPTFVGNDSSEQVIRETLEGAVAQYNAMNVTKTAAEA